MCVMNIVFPNPAQAVQQFFADSGPGCAEPRVVAFFGPSGPGSSGGASGAIPSYALDRRADMWHLLEWSSDHAHAPVAVTTRPQYWNDLDLLRWVSPRPHNYYTRQCSQTLCPGWRQAASNGKVNC